VGTDGFVLVRWKSGSAFSTDPADWSKGEVVNDSAREAALSPDGKQLAVIARRGSGPYELYLTKPGNVALDNAKSTSVPACKLAWQPDSRALVLMQADAQCNTEAVGTLVRSPVDDPTRLDQLKANGDNPTFLALQPGG
jgi:hypothetical protein